MKQPMPFTRPELDQLFNYCMVLCVDRDNALDLLQQGLEKYLQQAPGDVLLPMAYLRRMLRNLFIDQQRHNNIIAFESLDENAHFSANSENDIANLLIDEMELDRILSVLTAAEREVLYLWAVEGMTATEIALSLGQPRGTVLSRLHRLRKRLVYDNPASSGAAYE